MKALPNLYHRWAYIDELCHLLNEKIDLPVHLALNTQTIKIIRTMMYLDELSIYILNSFCHKNHPPQVDDLKKEDWIRSFLTNWQGWHEVLYELLVIQANTNKKEIDWKKLIAKKNKSAENPLKKTYASLHVDFDCLPLIKEKSRIEAFRRFAAINIVSLLTEQLIPDDKIELWNFLKDLLIRPEKIYLFIHDEHLHSIKIQYAFIEPFFRGIHQLQEMMMNIMLDMHLAIINDIKNIQYDKNIICHTEYQKITVLRRQMAIMKHFWEQSAQNIMLLNKMDSGSYGEYRQTILGTSGGDSKQLRMLRTLTTTLHHALPYPLQEEMVLKNAFHKNPNDILLNQLISAIRELQAAGTDFWLRHFNLTANTIGIVTGSQGLPVDKLLSYAIRPLMDPTSLVKTLGSANKDYAQLVKANIVSWGDSEKLIGDSIFSHFKNELEIIRRYEKPIMQPYRLDSCVLRPLEPNDTDNSPYFNWFSPKSEANKRFEMHSFGSPLELFEYSIQATSERLLISQQDYWEFIFSKRINDFQEILFTTLTIDKNEIYTVSIDNNVTALLERLLSALPQTKSYVVLTTDHEFLTVIRSLYANINPGNFEINVISIHPKELDITIPILRAIQETKNNLKMLIFSQVMANSQISLSYEEINNILNAVPDYIPIIIDITQGAFNVPINWHALLTNRTNIYLVGSCIKYARSTGGLGFLIHPKETGPLQKPKKSGWCAYFPGLVSGETVDHKGQLLYQQRWQWFGGTLGNIFSLELFINTWDAIIRTGENLRSMHDYVLSLHHYFYQLAEKNGLFNFTSNIVDAKRRDHFPSFSSGTLTIKMKKKQADRLVHYARTHHIHFDQRKNEIIRLGFGIQHGKNDIVNLIQLLLKFSKSISE